MSLGVAFASLYHRMWFQVNRARNQIGDAKENTMNIGVTMAKRAIQDKLESVHPSCRRARIHAGATRTLCFFCRSWFLACRWHEEYPSRWKACYYRVTKGKALASRQARNLKGR